MELYLSPRPDLPSLLPRTQHLLKQERYLRAVALLGEVGAKPYIHEVDWYLATVSPTWGSHIRKWYKNRSLHTGLETPATAQKVDEVLASGIFHLYSLHRMLVGEGWVPYRGERPVHDNYLQGLAVDSVASFLTPLLEGIPFLAPQGGSTLPPISV